MISAELPHQPYAGVVLSFEDIKFGVTLGGYLQQPPKSEEDFINIAKALPQPHIYNFLQSANPIRELNTYRILSQARKRIDKVRDFPRGLILLGDAYCRFDPLYGQGMSVAALEAEVLGDQLRSINTALDLDVLHKNYYKKLSKITQDPWDMATIESFRHPGITGKRPLGIGLKQWLTNKIYQSSANERNIYLLLAQVMNLNLSSKVFFRPSVLSKLFK